MPEVEPRTVEREVPRRDECARLTRELVRERRRAENHRWRMRVEEREPSRILRVLERKRWILPHDAAGVVEGLRHRVGVAHEIELVGHVVAEGFERLPVPSEDSR